MYSSGKMLGNIHEPHCDCNIEQHVSGASEKCNKRYGVKRSRSREKNLVRKFASEVDTHY